MKCGAVRKYLYGAEAFSPTTDDMAQARQHVAACRPCQVFFASEARVSQMLKQRASVEKAPASLRERLLAGLAAERRRAAERHVRKQGPRQWRPILAIAAVFLFVGSIATIIFLYTSTEVTPMEVASVLIADHVGASSQTMQIASGDRETVQGWFRQRVDFSFRLPPTPEPPLLGGRLCHLQGQRAALIAYQHSQSRLSLFIFDGRNVELSGDQLISLDGKQCLLRAEKGFNVVLWKDRGLLYGIVSDAPSADLLQLAAKF